MMRELEAAMGLGNINHFVVLMLENRSFDHIFGLRPGVDGILDKTGKPEYSNPTPAGDTIAGSGNAPFAIPTRMAAAPSIMSRT
jgi:phospholipase C